MTAVKLSGLWRVGYHTDPLGFTPRELYAFSHRFDDARHRFRTLGRPTADRPAVSPVRHTWARDPRRAIPYAAVVPVLIAVAALTRIEKGSAATGFGASNAEALTAATDHPETSPLLVEIRLDGTL